jgi:hypothetical protein
LLATLTEKSLQGFRFFKHLADDCFKRMSVQPESAVMDEFARVCCAVVLSAEFLNWFGAIWCGLKNFNLLISFDLLLFCDLTNNELK